MNATHETTRRTFLQTCAAGLNVAFPSQGDSAMPAPSPAPILRLEADPKRGLVPVLSWDTMGGERFHSNLLRKGTGVGLRVRTDGQ